MHSDRIRPPRDRRTERNDHVHRYLAVAVCATLGVGPQTVAADDDERPFFEFRRMIAFDVEYERGFRDRNGRPAREIEAKPLLRFAATIAPGRTWSGFFEADVLFEIGWQRARPREIDNIARINQAYLRYDDDLEVRFGRWLYRDEREWLIDENFDGILVNFDIGEVNVDAFAGRVGWLPRQLFKPHSRGDRVNHYGILAEVEPASNIHYAAFAILSDDRVRPDEHQLSLGLRSYGELVSGLDYWANAGLSLGRSNGRKLNGRGVDVGGTYSWRGHSLQPRLTLGYAWGSGDSDSGSETDTAYRQTGLQSNEARMGGFAKLKYYGEALDPDLSNIAIATAGLGLTSNDRLSLDLFYHHYREVAASAGASRHIGDGLDLVVGYRPTRGIEIDAAVGWFKSGHSEAGPRSGVVARIELEYSF